jgi:hypothetical protein
MWLARASALVSQVGNGVEIAKLSVASDLIAQHKDLLLREPYAAQITAPAHKERMRSKGNFQIAKPK